MDGCLKSSARMLPKEGDAYTERPACVASSSIYRHLLLIDGSSYCACFVRSYRISRKGQAAERCAGTGLSSGQDIGVTGWSVEHHVKVYYLG